MGLKDLSGVLCSWLCLCIVSILSAGGCSREQEKPQALPSSGVVETTTLLSTIADDERPHTAGSAPGHGVGPAVQNQPAYFEVVFNDRGRGVAYIAQKGTKVYVVHNDKAGRPYQAIGSVALSPDGMRIAYGALSDGKWCLVTDGVEGMRADDIGEPVFSPDSRHVAYMVRMGDKVHIVADGKMSDSYRSYNGKPEFSADSARIVYVEGPEENRRARLIVSDLTFQRRIVKEAAGAHMIVNGDRTRIAAISESDNKLRVIEFSFDRPDSVKEGSLYDGISHLSFGKDGVAVSYVAAKGGAHFVILNGREERLPEAAPVALPVIRPDRKGVGVIMATSENAFLHQAFYVESAKEGRYDEINDLVYNGDGSLHAYAARKGERWFIVVNGKEGPAFDRIVTPSFTPDGSLLVYRARKDGKRFVVVSDTNGKVVRQHSACEMVFPTVFTADGKSVAYGVKEGQKLIWRVEKLDK